MLLELRERELGAMDILVTNWHTLHKHLAGPQLRHFSALLELERVEAILPVYDPGFCGLWCGHGDVWLSWVQIRVTCFC